MKAIKAKCISNCIAANICPLGCTDAASGWGMEEMIPTKSTQQGSMAKMRGWYPRWKEGGEEEKRSGW